MAQKTTSDTQRCIDEVCGRFAEWDRTAYKVIGAQPHFVSWLDGGRSNTSALLQNSHHQWVLRIPQHTDPSICRHRELRVHETACAAGMAPRIAFADPEHGLLVTEYVTGENTDNQKPGDVAVLLRKIHKLPSHGPVLDAFAAIKTYIALGLKNHKLAALLATKRGVLESAAMVMRSWTQSVMCHNDLLAANRLVSSDGLLAIDWEYATAGNPFFDLAVSASEMNESDRNDLINVYLEATPTQTQRRMMDAGALLFSGLSACWFDKHHDEDAVREPVEIFHGHIKTFEAHL